jgi:hypothetical protein
MILILLLQFSILNLISCQKLNLINNNEYSYKDLESNYYNTLLKYKHSGNLHASSLKLNLVNIYNYEVIVI